MQNRLRLLRESADNGKAGHTLMHDNTKHFNIMKVIAPLILVISTALVSDLQSQSLVPPPPAMSWGKPTVVPPPSAVTTKLFWNGAKVEIYRTAYVIVDRYGGRFVINRPLPPQPPPQNGCGWLEHWLDTHDARSDAWRYRCIEYLYVCMNVR